MEKKTDFSQVKNYTKIDFHPGSVNIENVENLYYSDVLKALDKQLGGLRNQGSTERTTGNKQVKQKDELFSGHTCQGSTERKLPEELDTPEAHIVWERAKAAGYVDENLQPVVKLSQYKISILASEIGVALGLKPRWKPFTDFWGIKKLAQKYDASVDFKYKDGFEKEVRRVLSGDDKK